MVVMGTDEQRMKAIEMAKDMLRKFGELEQQTFPVEKRFHARLIGQL